MKRPSPPRDPVEEQASTDPLYRSPAHTPAQSAFLVTLRAAGTLTQGLATLLKPAGLTLTQYNALRILRGAGPRGLTCGEVGQRMLTEVPDFTRLLVRLERRGLVSRTRGEGDRRVVTNRITAGGLAILASLDEPVLTRHEEQFAALSENERRELVRLLEQIRGGLSGQEF